MADTRAHKVGATNHNVADAIDMVTELARAMGLSEVVGHLKAARAAVPATDNQTKDTAGR